MSNSVQRDQRRRKLFAKLEGQRLLYKCTIRDQNLPANAKAQAVQRLNNIDRNSSLVRVRNRCVLSGRSRGVYKFSRLSRIKIRELACQGLITGLCKTSW